MGKESLTRVFGKQEVGIEVGGKAGGIYSENKEQEAFERLQVVLRTEGWERKSLLWQLGREWKEEGEEEPISGAWLAGKFLAEEGRRWRETAEVLTVRSDGDKVAIDFLRGYWENTIWGYLLCRSAMLGFLNDLAEKRGGKEKLAEGEAGESLGWLWGSFFWSSLAEKWAEKRKISSSGREKQGMVLELLPKVDRVWMAQWRTVLKKTLQRNRDAEAFGKLSCRGLAWCKTSMVDWLCMA